MVVNAGGITNQFYRRAVSLERNGIYKISVYLGIADYRNLPKIQFKAQNIQTEEVLGNSDIFQVTDQTYGVWHYYEWIFKIPDNINCGGYIHLNQK